MTGTTGEILWIVGFCAAFAAIHLTFAEGDDPSRRLDFDRPLARTLTAVLTWLVALMVAIFAITLSGLVWPLLGASLIWTAFGAARRLVDLRPLTRLALPLALIGLLSVLLLFQTVYGDQSFGLINIFPER